MSVAGPLAGVAHGATSSPPWEPDPLAAAPYGTLSLYNSAGVQVTTGNNLSHLFDYAMASTGPDAGATKANLIFAAPNHAQPTSGWYVAAASASTNFPNSSAPPPLNTSANPVVTLAATDANLAAFLGGAVLDTTSGYANIIQLRVKDSGPGGVTSGLNYWDADVAYNQGSAPIVVDGATVPPGGWAQVYPGIVATPTTTSLSSSANPSVTGQAVTYTATVSPAAATGTVAFKDGSTTITGCGAQTVTAGSATCTVTYSAAGSHTITAAYGGSATYAASTSAPLTQTVNVVSVPTSTALTSSANPSVSGQRVTYSAKVTPASGSGVPGGSVAFKDGSTTISGCSAQTLTAGAATCTVAYAGPGSHAVTAVYGGAGSYTGSTSPALTQTVNKAATSTALTSSVNPSYTGQPVTYTATPSITTPGAGNETGTVAFSDGTTPVSGCGAVALAGGKATCTVTYTAAGTHSLTAAYSGDADFAGSTSGALVQTVALTVVPGAPTGLRATGGSSQVALAWSAPSSNGGSTITGYDVYKGTSAGGESITPVNASPVTSTNYTVTGLTNGTTYYFVVKALNAVGPSAPSNEASATPRQSSYRMVGSDGAVYSFPAGSPSYGSLKGIHLNAPIVGMATTSDNGGYLLAGSDGGVFSFGDAKYFGSLGNVHLNAPVVGIAGTPDNGGYWLVAADGGVFSFGDAKYFGSLGSTHLNAPVVGMAAAPNDSGYWLVGGDGGVFSFGAARYFGSTGNVHLNKPMVGITSLPDGSGYRLVARDGGIFAFGAAKYYGSTGDIALNQPVVAMKATSDNGGYWLFAADGGVFTFGDAGFQGSVPGTGVSVSNVIGGA